ncbi:hypothetical protein Kpol_1075p3 [Vanderwaltozyma polyspora DSM 70294]|uniref:CCA tRNA nucleotidyltransferase, mitochondrial n=1 Tax=Vanderwaltozyma polyspora (strain ATCC 22028 / DSM 70294 / BCRC 21397 / CBS 2163 / NBRC 10782 / NRRL Y-8283 / UCD 57-17) TaxID=436907 RepID=A7TSN1_VANPO|nr:uncharacterized protein Kpol_1075p3 [Vanderwaltozyma polyspora DSM 70294]EDO14725.1 hypothetical protein Kpol_1075p3 [Vanderwaltozyma polyspora DSM 70294]
MFRILRNISTNKVALTQLKKFDFKAPKMCIDQKPVVQLNSVEQKVCQLLIDFTNDYNSEQKPTEPLELRITGGWVRDKLLGSESHDLDIAINIMSGENFATKLNDFLQIHYDRYNLKPHSIHKIDKNPEKSKHLETATTKLFDVEVDFVNLRSEEYTENSRIPTVEFGTPEQDALRRDATLNALFYNISKKEVEDFTGRGIEDLSAGILRTPLPPRKTFLDDPLRVLRLIRFASRFNFQIEDSVKNAMSDKDINKAFYTKISRERIGVEMEKIFDGKTPLIGLSLIQETCIDNVIFHWHNDQSIIDYNEESNPQQFALINEIYDKNILNDHLWKVISIVKDRELLSLQLPTLFDKLDNDQSFKRMYLLSSILLPFQNLMIIWNPKKKMNNTIPVTESIVKDGLKMSKNEAVVVSQIVNGIESYYELVYKFKNDRVSLKRSDIGNFLRDFKGNWEIAHYVSLLNQLLANNEAAMNDYSHFWNFIFEEKLDVCHTLRPMIDGKKMAKILDLKPGPWLGKLNEYSVTWQLDNPEGSEEELLDHLREILPTLL